MNQTVVRLVQTTIFLARGKSRHSESIIFEVAKGAIEPGESDSWHETALKIPPLPPSELPHCNNIQIKYRIEVGILVNYENNFCLTVSSGSQWYWVWSMSSSSDSHWDNSPAINFQSILFHPFLLCGCQCSTILCLPWPASTHISGSDGRKPTKPEDWRGQSVCWWKLGLQTSVSFLWVASVLYTCLADMALYCTMIYNKWMHNA